MPRQARFLPPNNFYHIINRSNNRMPIFTCNADYQFYLKNLEELKDEHPFDLYHFCLMPTHTHFLVKIIKKTDFSTFSKRLNLSYSSYCQRNYGFIGHLWQGRFKSQLIDKDPYLIQCGKYIELNPVKNRIVGKPEDYPWSSYQYYAQGKKNRLMTITEDIFYQELGKTPKERQKNFQNMVISEVIQESMDRLDVAAVGNEQFTSKINRRVKYHQDHKTASYRKTKE